MVSKHLIAGDIELLAAITPFKPTEEAPVPTLKQVRDALPAECFKHNSLRSLSLVVRDGLIISALLYAGWQLPGPLSSPAVFAMWMLYAWLQGAALTGWWVLAHECGHGGFSNSTWLNNTVGFVLHSVLLVPFFSWQYSHAKHHSKCNHLLDGETHVPPKGVDSFTDAIADVLGEDAFAFYQTALRLLLGWPMYLLINATGARRRFDKKRYTSKPSHFSPFSELFPTRWRPYVVLSTMGILAWLSVLVVAAQRVGAWRVAMLYGAPYLVVNFWLVLYTWLQHVNETTPQYGEDQWTWMKGALATIDRPYWGPVDWMHHHIGSTHVAHHIFSQMPCYHAQRATVFLKTYLGDLYRYDSRPIYKATYEISKSCHYVDSVHGEQYFRSVFTHHMPNKKKNMEKTK